MDAINVVYMLYIHIYAIYTWYIYIIYIIGDVVYACGLNNYGQLGLGGEYEKYPQIDNLTLVPLLCNKGILYIKYRYIIVVT